MQYIHDQLDRFEKVLDQFRAELKEFKQRDERIAKLEATMDSMSGDIKEIKEAVARINEMLVDRIQANGKQDGMIEALEDRVSYLEVGLKSTTQKFWAAILAALTAFINGIMLWIFGR